MHAVGNGQVAIGSVRHPHDDDLALFNKVLLRDESGILRILVRVEDRRVVETKDLAELV